MSTEHIILTILIIYTGILHYQLHKKNVFIESLLHKQLNEKSSLTIDELEAIISKLKGLPYDSMARPTKLFEAEVQNFIFENDRNQFLFIHYTKDSEVAQRICHEGFRFVDSFYKTAESISNDKLDFIYKHNLRKHFGNFVIVIAIGKDVYDNYTRKISSINKALNVEQVLSIIPPQINDNQDEVYLLPPQFVKGYIDIHSGEVFPNTQFNPEFESPQFTRNIEDLK